jgi:hypothetical protein
MASLTTVSAERAREACQRLVEIVKKERRFRKQLKAVERRTRRKIVLAPGQRKKRSKDKPKKK